VFELASGWIQLGSELAGDTKYRDLCDVDEGLCGLVYPRDESCHE
jgi:hypothetical protein